MSHEKRFLIAIGLTVAFLYVWFQYFVPKPAAPTVPVADAQAPAAAVPGSAAPIAAKAAAPTRPAKTEILDSDLWSATLADRPAGPVALKLKKYGVTAKPDAARVEVIPIGNPAKAPLTWRFDLGGKEVSDDALAYALVAKQAHRSVYEAKADTATIRKTWDLDPAGYASTLTLDVVNGGASTIKVAARTTLDGALSAHDRESGGMFKPRVTPLRSIAYVNGHSNHWALDAVKKGAEVPAGDIAWAGFDSQYFLLAAIPTEGRWEKLSLAALPDGETVEQTFAYPAWNVEPGKSLRYGVRLYAGPKDIAALEAIGPAAHLDRAIDLGDWLGLVARPMMKFLRFAHGLIPNYGVAIILLTVLVRLLLTPLTQMQAKSMKRMQEHKPYMDQLKERYKDDKEAYSRELMTYMRTHKINPMGGCLLLLPQLPIFFALYRVLYNSIELRHEPFVFWIRDLAAHDPYFVMPVLLGIAMFFQQKFTPSPSADEAQQMMMKIMPVMFTVFMLFLPAGLNLYILVSTLWGVAQQYRIQRSMAPAPVLTKKAG